jgi:hypothetical protein
VHGRHARHTGVEGDQQVEGLGAAHLADDEALGAHAQRLAHEVAQRDLPAPLDTGRARLHGDVVPVRQ